MAKQQVAVNGGMGLCGWVFLLLLALKLTVKPALSWFWVLAPLWIPLAITVGVLLVIGLVFLVAAIADACN